MRSGLLLLPVLVASGTIATGICATHEPTQEQMQLARNLQNREINARFMGKSLANQTGIKINVYYHVIAESTADYDGFIAPSDLERQTEALNERFRPHNISWTQAGADWSIAPQWSGNQDEHTMKRFLRKGTYADMNVYIFPSIEYFNDERIFEMVTLQGYAEFPKIVTPQSGIWYQDAVSIRSDTMPGSATMHNLGMTLVHEAGHWLGLYHTFRGGCYGEGDGIDDTPAESRFYNFGGNKVCDLTRDSCPGDGTDPVTNYMNYSDETCYSEFTPGQEVRMYSQWAEFRASHQRL